MKTIIAVLLFTSCVRLLAQQVVATAGNTFGNENGSLSYTIGEGVAQTLTKGDKTITQGFHQTTMSGTMVSELKDLDFSIFVFPNPTSDMLKIKVTKENVPGLQYLLFDINGKLIFQKNLESNETDVPVHQLAIGYYIIKVQAGTKELKTFKIIKE
ncbi:MAG: T9SS type A sorting domain-containing protein [Bacteroidia bacterium]|nr:T9SS type A sorting domain-containing protein [Bacteroidia bacterium]